MANDQLIYGLRPIIQAVQDGQTIDKVFLQKGLGGTLYTQLEGTLRDAGIVPKYVPVEKLNRVTRGNHQGAVAYLSPIDFFDLEEIIAKALEENRNPLILALDRITDVRNFGAIARTADCSGVDAIVIPKNDSAPVSADAVRTSTGALLEVPVCKVAHMKDAVFVAQSLGLKIIAATEKSETSMYEAPLGEPCMLIMGNEETGVHKSLLQLADAKALIPMSGQINSLNVSVATGVLLYEAVRQRKS
jgi:23S rRNA (guanosine2251-2'-O)-methyltransferase